MLIMINPKPNSTIYLKLNAPNAHSTSTALSKSLYSLTKYFTKNRKKSYPHHLNQKMIIIRRQ